MSTPFLGQISTFGFGYPPKGFAFCNGQLLPVVQNQALFSLLGTTYGGDGRTTFALPNLQGSASLGVGTAAGGGTYTQGQLGGEVNHTLLSAEMPAHVHPPVGSTAAATSTSPAGAYPTTDTIQPFSTTVNGPISMQSANAGGSQAHPNQSPFLVINFCIALVGIFPSRN